MTRRRNAEMADRRIEHLDREPDGCWMVTLRPGWAYADANKPNAQHVFGEDTKSDVTRSMRSVVRCACPQCKATP